MSSSSSANPRTSVRPVPVSEIASFDHEADVVVAGYGIAGVSAAIGAATEGADVLVLERTGGWGGAASLSGGFLYLGGGTATQRACGFDDTVDDMKKFLDAALGPGVDRAKLDAYCDGSVAHHDWLVDAGVEFKPSFWDQPGWEPPYDDGLAYSGGENAAPFSSIATPAPRGHVPRMEDKRTGEKGGGYMLMQPLAAKAEELGVRSLYDVRVRALIVDGDAVVGILATQYGTEVAIRARRGVVLATGSFAYDKDMIERFAPRLVNRPAASIEEHDGIGIRLGQAVGADLAHMDATEVAFFCDPQLFVRGILVNGHGNRYVTEDTYPGHVGQATLLRNDNQAFLVIDEAAYEEGAAAPTATVQLRMRPKWVCETVEELESETGLPAGSLQATVDRYNRYAEQGEDPDFGKRAEWLRPIGSPVAAVDLRNMTGGFTLGGLRTSVDSEVLHVDGEPIPGLYAAGRCTSGMSAYGYCSGISLGDGSFFGRRAGIAAARRA